MTQATFIQAGTTFDHTPVGAIGAGDVVVLNAERCAVAKTPIAAGALGALATFGIFDAVKKQEALSAGDWLYWDADGDPYGGTAGSGALTATAADGVSFGFAVADAEATDGTVRACLVSVPTQTVLPTLNAENDDPGNGEALAVTGGYTELVTTDAHGDGSDETRTLSTPTRIGDERLLFFDTKDTADVNVNVDHAINAAGNDQVQFDGEGHFVRLVAVEISSGLVWRIVVSDGVTLGTQ